MSLCLCSSGGWQESELAAPPGGWQFPWPEEWHDRVLDSAEQAFGMELNGPQREPPEIVAIAYEALTATLPAGWTMNTTPDGMPYYWYSLPG